MFPAVPQLLPYLLALCKWAVSRAIRRLVRPFVFKGLINARVLSDARASRKSACARCSGARSIKPFEGKPLAVAGGRGLTANANRTAMGIQSSFICNLLTL